MLDIRIWEVGAGLSVRIKTPNGKNHFIDAGASPDFSPAEHIARHYWSGEDQVDFLLISHQDADHVRDLPKLLQHLGAPAEYLRNSSVPHSEKYGKLERQYQLDLKDLDDRYTNPVSAPNSQTNPSVNGGVVVRHTSLDWKTAGSINNASIIASYEYAGTIVIFPGDIEDAGWLALRQLKGNPFDSPRDRAERLILIAPHHGRPSGYSSDMIKYLKPDLVVVSDGYGAGETDQRFRSAGSGLEIKGLSTKFVSTKTQGRKRLLVRQNGTVEVD